MADAVDRLPNKVPAITVLFWIMKVLTTGLGEATSDALTEIALWISALVSLVLLALVLGVVFRSPWYRTVPYWSAVALVAVFGTVMADFFTPPAGGYVDAPLWLTTAVYAVLLTLCFALWWRSEHTLSIHTITTRRRQGFYWATVLLTFALGTAAGDWTAFELNLGFPVSILLFGGGMLVPLVLWRAGVNATACFWAAYILTRPFGASIADELSQERPMGLGWGATPVALGAIALLVVFVAIDRLTGFDDPDRRQRSPALASAPSTHGQR